MSSDLDINASPTQLDDPELDDPELDALELDVPGRDSDLGDPDLDDPDLDDPDLDAPELSAPKLSAPKLSAPGLGVSAIPPRLAARLEAILYVKAQPMSITVLSELAGVEREDIEEALIELMQDYVQRDSALEILETDAGYSLQLKESYQSLVSSLIPTDLGVGALRTLAAIALKGPIAQTDLVELRGSGAYQHVQELVELGFVQKRRSSSGRSAMVQVTDQFYQYFEVDQLPTIQG